MKGLATVATSILFVTGFSAPWPALMPCRTSLAFQSVLPLEP